MVTQAAATHLDSCVNVSIVSDAVEVLLYSQVGTVQKTVHMPAHETTHVLLNSLTHEVKRLFLPIQVV